MVILKHVSATWIHSRSFTKAGSMDLFPAADLRQLRCVIVLGHIVFPLFGVDHFFLKGGSAGILGLTPQAIDMTIKCGSSGHLVCAWLESRRCCFGHTSVSVVN